jgi:hypothetical protein
MATAKKGIGAIQTLPGARKKATSGKNPNGLPTLKYPGDIGYTPVKGVDVNIDPLSPTDTTFNYDPITASTIAGGANVTAGKVSADKLANQFMTAADYSIVDPSKISQEYGDIARSQMKENAKLSSDLALQALDTELKGLQSYAPAAAALQRGEVAKDNTFNQAQRLAQLDQGDPRLRSDLEGQAGRARAFAEGRVPDPIQDRALELGIRSSAADAASAGGFGVRSGAARKASELMSAQQRIGLSQYGDQLLTSNIKGRSDLLLAPTEYSTAGSQIKATPTQSAAQIGLAIASQANDKTIISSETALANQTQQQEFKTGLEQDTRKFNTGLAAQKDLNQAQLNLQAGTTNVDTALRADLANQQNTTQVQSINAQNAMSAQEVNARNAIQSQSTAMGIRSNEAQFNSQLQFNVKNANAAMAFNAANINAGRALDVASNNRAVRLDVQKTNKSMIFQDIQARRAEAAASARAAMAERGANARAAMSASLQRDAIAANTAAQQSAQAFTLQQQQQALDQYNKGAAKGSASQDAATTGNLIARSPSVIAGAGSIAAAGSSIYNSFGSNSSTTTSAGTPYTGSYDYGGDVSVPDTFTYDNGGTDYYL